jgi:hypothetical protein
MKRKRIKVKVGEQDVEEDEEGAIEQVEKTRSKAEVETAR